MLTFPKVTLRAPRQRAVRLPIPVGGVNRLASPVGLSTKFAYTLDNFILYPGQLVARPAVTGHVTGFANTVKRLHAYTSVAGVSTLWATTVNGVFNATTAGAAPAASIALTNGVTQGAILSTGAQNYLILVNGADSMVIYDGAVWAATATVGGGAINTNTFSYVEVYRQRVFFVVENTTRIVYLNANTPTGGGTNYDLAAIFRRGGYIVALGTWTIDGGTGPDDYLVIVTSEGEVAVFTGNDPATWVYKGTFFIAPPLGLNPLFKFGGDLLYLCGSGVYPLSKALLTATIDKSAAITNLINPIFVGGLSTDSRYQMAFDPTIPALMVNITTGRQWCMNTQLMGWFSYSSSGYTAECLAYFSARMYMGTGTNVAVFNTTATKGTDMGPATYSARYQTGYTNFGTTGTLKVDGVQPIIQMGSIGGAPPPGTVQCGTLAVGRAVFDDGVGDFLAPAVPLMGGDIPSRVVSRWYSLPDDYSPFKSLEMVWTSTGAFAAVPEVYYGATLTYSIGGVYNNAGRPDSANV